MKEEEMKTQTIIIESNEAVSRKNYKKDFGLESSGNEPNSWSIKLPKSIKVNPGDELQYYQSSIKTRGLDSEKVELIGTAEDEELTDNEVKIDFNYYVNNNWLNNIMLPLGLATSKYTDRNTNKFRVFDFKDDYHNYNIPLENNTNIYKTWLSDYGGPLLDGINDWNNNSAYSLYAQANELNFGQQIGIGPAPDYTPVNIETNTITSSNLAYYTPDTQRLYLGQDDFAGFYNNGYDGYHNTNYSNTVTKEFALQEGSVDVQLNQGFNTPIVLGNDFTRALNREVKETEYKPMVIDYKDTVDNTGLQNFTGYYKIRTQDQLSTKTQKIVPTTFGKVLYDLKSGKETFSINQDTNTKTNIPLMTSEQMSRYYWNNILTGDINRTLAMSKLHNNLYKSKNIDTISESFLDNASYFSGNIPPQTNWDSTSFPITTNSSYPSSQPYNFGEQMVVMDDLTSFSTTFVQSDLNDVRNNRLVKYDNIDDFKNTVFLTKQRPLPGLDRYLNLSDGKVIMTNMVANNENFEKIKKVQDLLTKYDINNNEYFSLELGRMDDKNTQICYNLNNSSETPNKLEETGIILPTNLPCVNSVGLKLEPTDKQFSNLDANRKGAPYEQYGGRMRLPLYAGLFCDRDDISIRFENNINQVANDILAYTHLNRFRDNKSYQLDFHSKYSQTDINNAVFPDNSTSKVDKNGDLFDDSKIKELNLGVVVGYKNITQEANSIREIGLGTQQSPSQFDFYSVDTTTPNYDVNANTFVNILSGPGSSTNNFGDNSVSSGLGSTSNGTLRISQNTTNSYSETANKEVISPSQAMVIEYDSITGIRPNSLDLYQQASFPDGTAPQENTSILGAGAGDEQATLTDFFNPLRALENAFNDFIGDYNTTPQQGYFSEINNLTKGFTAQFRHPQIVDRFLIWRTPGSTETFCQVPKFITISGSNDGNTYTQLFTNVAGTPFTITDYPSTASIAQQKASQNLDRAKVIEFTNTSAYLYYKIEVPEIIAPGQTGGTFRLGASQFSFTIKPAFETTLGAGINLSTFTSGGGSVSVQNNFQTSTTDRAFNGTTGSYTRTLVMDSPNTITIDYGIGNAKNIKKFLIWSRYSNITSENPRFITVTGSNDNFTTSTTLYTNVGGTAIQQADYPTTTEDMVCADNLDKAITTYLTTTGDFRYYKFVFIGQNISGNTRVGVGELALYEEVTNNNTQSRFPKSILLQGQRPGELNWTTIEKKELTTSPEAAGYDGPPETRPVNPVLADLVPALETVYNDSQTLYRKLRLIITETFSLSQNSVAIGEMVIEKFNNTEVLLGNTVQPDPTVTLIPIINTKQSDGTYEEDPEKFVNANSATDIDNVYDGNNHTICRFSMNTDEYYSTSQNQVFIGDSSLDRDKRWVGFQYEFDPPLSVDEFYNWSTNDSAQTFEMAKEVEIQGLQIRSGATIKVVELFNGNLADLKPVVTTTSSISEEAPYNTVDSQILNNEGKDKFDVIMIIVKSTYNTNVDYNTLSVADWVLAGYDDDLDSKQIPFIGFVCRDQISSKNLDSSGNVVDDKYKIPMPIRGEFFGIPRSLQNNSFSFLNSWERQVVNDTRGFCVTDVKVVNGGTLKLGVGDIGKMLVSLAGGGKDSNNNPNIIATIELDSIFYDGGSDGFGEIISGTITNNGAGYYGIPSLEYSWRKNDGTIIRLPPTDDDKWLQYPQLELTIGDYKTSYTAGTVANTQPQFPYVVLGANQPTMSFDTEESRMSIQNLHTPLKNGQQSNNLQRYFDGSQVYNSEDSLTEADANSAQNVIMINNAKFNCNSARAGFTEGMPEQNFKDQILPVSNPAIKQIGYTDSLCGIGIKSLSVKNNITKEFVPLTESNYAGTLLEKLGFDLNQLIPQVGNQSEKFQIYLHNEYLEGFDFHNMSQASVKPFTTNSIIPSTINQDTNVNNIGYLIGSIDGTNTLQKIIEQEPASLIANNLAQKLAYSHLLVYTNILPKYSYIGSESINELNCIGRIDRSYTLGDIIYGNTSGEPYVFDKMEIISELSVDLRTETGLPATIDRGSTVVFKIVRKV